MTPFINRELSWLEFNQRVLAEALRDDLPLLERVKFLAISASNLDEFFQVRVGGLMLMLRSGRKTPDPSGFTPARSLAAIRQRVLEMNAEQYALFNETIRPALAAEQLILASPQELAVNQTARMAALFEDSVLPLLTPLAVDLSDPLTSPQVPSLHVVVACRLHDQEAQTSRHALIPIPESIGRFLTVAVEDRPKVILLIEDVVAAHAARLFPGESVTATTAFRLTRNGDIVVQEEDAVDFAGEMENVLTARRYADTVRLELRKDTPRDLATMIQKVTASSPREVFRINGPPGLASLMDMALTPGFDHLRHPEWPPQNSPALAPHVPMFDAIDAEDILLHHPYESFEPVLRFIEEAATDPEVIAIKQVLYRTARHSRIIDSLILAATQGKQVTVLVELKARFDEARNLLRADELQRAGVQIVYGVKALKTHAKICLVIRRENGGLRRYVHLGTGNYNESTAKLYTDLSYFTSKPEYGHDASLFFNAVTGRSKLLRFAKLVPAPTSMKPLLLEMIAGEADRARQGLPARIIAKMNSLQDPDIIKALYKASKAGVEIKLNVRGICCLKPGDPKASRNIQVISVVDRYLEHARLFYFHQDGDPQFYLSSADWMTRNLEKRIELMIPIEEPKLRRRLLKILEAYFEDNTQSSEILANGRFRRVTRAKGEKAFRVQEHFQQLAKRAAKDSAHERSMSFEPHVPS